MICRINKLVVGSGPAQALTARPNQSSRPKSRLVTVMSLDPDAAAVLNVTRRRIGSRKSTDPVNPSRKSTEVDPEADFVTKLKAAWRIFFPEKKRSLSPKEEGKKRLRMILVADRCGMSTDSLVGMRESIVKAMENFVEVESEEAVEVNLSMDPEIGTIYSVAVPVRRVKPTMRPSLSENSAVPGATWDPTDPESDPSDQFPWGT